MHHYAAAKESIFTAFQRQQDATGIGCTIPVLPSLGVCCPLPLSSEESGDLVKNIIYSMSFPNSGPSAPAEAAAYSAEGASKARGSRKPEVFE